MADGAVVVADDESYLSSYQSALSALLSSEHQAMTKEAIEKTSQRRTQTVQDMHVYMQRIGLLDEDLQPITTMMMNDTNSDTSSSNTNHEVDDGTISVIHVAGTKGKGSVCAMCEVMVRHQPQPTKKDPTKMIMTGLFTSPHLVDIRERIRINGLPVSKRIFGQTYWLLRKRLEQYHRAPNKNNNNKHQEATANTVHTDGDKNYDDEIPILPGYFRMITLMAWFIFKHYRSDDGRRITCIVLEVGMGGRYDATNVRVPWLYPTTVCGTTLIDYDHVRILGHTLPEIAWEKGGIYTIQKECRRSDHHQVTPHPTREQDHFRKALANLKAHGNVATSQQRRPRCFALDTNEESVLDVFRLCAMNEGGGHDLIVAGKSSSPNSCSSSQYVHLPNNFELGLKGIHQRDNAELAIALCQAILTNDQPVEKNEFATNHNTAINNSNIYEALSDMTWPGRCQTVVYNKVNIDATTERQNDSSSSPSNNNNNCNSNIPVTIRLDGAHTMQSLRAGLEWYSSVTTNDSCSNSNAATTCHILVFNCSHERNPVELLDLIYGSKTTTFHAVYFCRADSERPSAITKSSTVDLWRSASNMPEITDADIVSSGCCCDMGTDAATWQDTLLGIWNLLEYTSTTTSSDKKKAIDRASNLTCIDAIQRGCQFATSAATASTGTNQFTSIEFFCTGSLYLVGSMLSASQWQEDEATGTLATQATTLTH